MTSTPLRLTLVVFASVLLGWGCGKKASTKTAADSTGTDSTSLANAKGSMENEGENYGKTDAPGDTASANKPKKERSVTVNVSRASFRRIALRDLRPRGAYRGRRGSHRPARTADREAG